MAISRKQSVTGIPESDIAKDSTPRPRFGVSRSNEVQEAVFVPEQMTEREIAKALGGEIEVSANVFNKEQLGSIDSFDAAMALAVAEFGGVIAAHEQALLGDGFKVASEDDKRRLAGVPLLLLSWSFKASDYGQDQEWVFIHAVQRGENGEALKWIISDGGTGIARDLKEFTAKTGRVGGMAVKNGLRVSEYYIDGDKASPDFGKALSKTQVREYMVNKKPLAEANTFYLDTSA